MNPTSPVSPTVFKGIALFTPGGDLVYCIDPDKQARWHVHLCNLLQQLLDLPEPPHFLVPCYTATIDRWLDPSSQQLQTVAEASPLVLRYRNILNSVFSTPNLDWKLAQLPLGNCDPALLLTYRHQFPQLWEPQDLVLAADSSYATLADMPPSGSLTESPERKLKHGQVLRLFVAGHSMATEQTLRKVHHLLEVAFREPYTLKVIDVTQHPEQAEAYQITATPTLMRIWPKPIRRVVGTLDSADQITYLLQSHPAWHWPEGGF